MKPLTFDDYHKLGEQVAKELEPRASYRKIGDELGLTKQRAWHIAMVALGKVAHQLRRTYEQ